MARKLPEWFEKDYSDLKKNLWGALRAFVSGFIATLTVHLVGLSGDNLSNWDWWLKVVLTSSITGGLVFLGKWLRDTFYESPDMQRIPI
jgi:hypothetical protein